MSNMKFDKIWEAREWFLDYKPTNEKIISFWYEYDFTDWKFGHWILFQHQKAENNISVLSRPILAIFTSFSIWDQALVLNYIQKKRAWMWSHEVVTNPDPKYNFSMHVGSLDDEVETIQFWTDNIKVLGHWKDKPTLSDIKKSLLNSEQNPEECDATKMP